MPTGTLDQGLAVSTPLRALQLSLWEPGVTVVGDEELPQAASSTGAVRSASWRGSSSPR